MIDLSDPSIDLPDPLIDLFDPSIDLPDASIDLFEPSIDLPDPSIDLFEPLIDRFVGSIDPFVGSIDPEMINRGVKRSFEGPGEIKRWSDQVMKEPGKDSRGRFLIKRGVEIDIRGVRDAVDVPERAFRPSKMNNRGAGDINQGVKRSFEGSNDHSRGS